ncbi:MAG: response regulator transcription factor [Chloroflexi bacterium]|nr:response regulator transcription factor [Chloroflexota bacterium]
MAAEHMQRQHTPTVLVIDDEDYVADMLASALEIEGYTVHLAYNGRDGLALAQTLRVNLVIIDIMMPYMNGITLIHELRKLDHTVEVPIILISAGARPRDQMAGVNFMPKPFDLDHMLALIATTFESSGVDE